MPIATPSIAVTPLEVPNSNADFGTKIENVDLENLSGKHQNLGALRGAVTSYDDNFAVIRDALYRSLVVLIKNQSNLSPKAQAELTHRFDPAAFGYGHGKSLSGNSILHPDLKTVPHQPEVQIIGNGPIASYEGLENFKLKHPHHRTFHKHPIPEAEDLEATRFYRWHIDAALYDLHPPMVTTLMAVRVPKGRTQTLRYDDGSGEEMQVPLGTTSFVSGERMYELLSDSDKAFARTTKVEYAPHPYVWMSGAKSRSDGLGLYSDGHELDESQLPPIDKSKIQIMPMCWRNPVTGALALQIHPSAVRVLHLADGSVIDDLAKVREIVHKLQRPAISPQYVYSHDWEEGDLVLFNNRALLHSVVGAFAENEVRLFRQCNLAASEPPVGPEEIAV